MFVIGAYLDEQEIGQGMGLQKKKAEQAAAQDAIEKLTNRPNSMTITCKIQIKNCLDLSRMREPANEMDRKELHACNQWNTFIQEIETPQRHTALSAAHHSHILYGLTKCSRKIRRATPQRLSQCDRLLGGGVVVGLARA